MRLTWIVEGRRTVDMRSSGLEIGLRRRLSMVGLAALLACVMGVAAAGCGSEQHDAAQSGSSGYDSGASSGGASSAASGDAASDSGAGSDGDKVVSRENPGFDGMDFDGSRNAALIGAQPLDIVTWTVEPAVADGELVAEGVVEQGATLFSPMTGEGSAFSVFYMGHEESLVELLPDLGPMQIWNTDLTVAPTEMEIEGPTFRLRAYSPLFMDVGTPSELQLWVFGVDQAGNDAILAVRSINAG